MREKTPPEVKEQRERERELKELDRDTRTVFAYNLNLKAEERDLFEFFSKAGKVVDVKIIMDRNTRKSKGFSYIEFQNRVCVCSSRQSQECSNFGLYGIPQDSAPPKFAGPSWLWIVPRLPRIVDRPVRYQHVVYTAKAPLVHQVWPDHSHLATNAQQQ